LASFGLAVAAGVFFVGGLIIIPGGVGIGIGLAVMALGFFFASIIAGFLED